MGWNTQQQMLSAGVLVAGLIAMQAAVAAPPLHTQLPVRPQLPQRLDLSAPSHLPGLADNAADRSFPSRRQTLGAHEAFQQPVPGAANARARPTIQEFVRRVHQEGLPVARLFEGKSALVHLGLSPKGKPGLWLVQKTH
jgi:hypothetical protein